MRTSVITFIAALVLGLVAAIGVFVYASGAQDRAMADQQPVGVFVSTEIIPAGTTMFDALERGALSPTQVPTISVPDGALLDTDAGQRVALGDIPPGQVVLAAAFGDSMPLLEPIAVPEDELAVTLELGDPQRVGDFLRPGSRIAIFNTAAEPDRRTRLLLFDIQVLAVGAATTTQDVEDQDSSTQTALVTVAVTAANAERLIHATQTGSPYLALIGETTSPVLTTGVSDTDLFEEES